MAVAMLWRSDFALESAACCLYVAYCGIAIAARMPMIATTTSSSINVKPCSFPLFIFPSLLFRQTFLVVASRLVGSQFLAASGRPQPPRSIATLLQSWITCDFNWLDIGEGMGETLTMKKT